MTSVILRSVEVDRAADGATVPAVVCGRRTGRSTCCAGERPDLRDNVLVR